MIRKSLWKLVGQRSQNRVSVCYLMNQWMDFDQTCIDALLGGGEEKIKFW